MGESIEKTTFDENDRNEFVKRLRNETLILKKMLETRSFEYSEHPCMGLEVEAWLVDQNEIPSPSNREFIKSCQNKDIVEEISQFNFELNTDPLVIGSGCLTQLHKNLGKAWHICHDKAQSMELNPFLVGIHPLVRDEMLQPQYMSEGGRYKALNDEIFHLREEAPIQINIQGFDQFKMQLHHILIEAAATSIQVHLQTNQENFGRMMNASLIASAPCVAVAANSPFLYSHDLWAETRIPLFEQSISLKQFRDKKGKEIGRVSFGTGYIKHSPLEIFLENLNGYSPLVPILFDDAPEKLHHLRFHNGTLWRWNRPIIGFNSEGLPHFRIEQRAMASGPTIADIVANTAFAMGLTEFLALQDKAPEESMTFTDCRNNFYSAARYGLDATLRWFGKKRNLSQLMLEELIPQAEEGLKSCGVSQEEIDYYLKDIIHSRVLSGQNGAKWQRAFIHCHGRDFQALAKEYHDNMKTGRPVHQWIL
jgi:gamma-glutamyl:cysteine ligase YbdK (ATP-grasp superfamily)